MSPSDHHEYGFGEPMDEDRDEGSGENGPKQGGDSDDDSTYEDDGSPSDADVEADADADLDGVVDDPATRAALAALDGVTVAGAAGLVRLPGLPLPLPRSLENYVIAVPHDTPNGAQVMCNVTVTACRTAAGNSRIWTIQTETTGLQQDIGDAELYSLIDNQCKGTGSRRPPPRKMPKGILGEAPERDDEIWVLDSSLTGQSGIAMVPDPTGATTKNGYPKNVKTGYVVQGAEIIDGTFSQVFATADVSSSLVLYLSIDQHQQGTHAVRFATKSTSGSKHSHWISKAARIRTADDDADTPTHGQQVQSPQFRKDVFDSLLSQVAVNVERDGGSIEYMRRRARVPLKRLPKSVEDDYREAFGPVIVAMNNEVPGASDLFNALDSFLRSNIPKGENRVPYIRQRIGWIMTGSLEKLEAASEKRETSPPPSTTPTNIHSRKASVARRAERALAQSSLRSARRAIDDHM